MLLFHKTCDLSVIICDRDSVIALAGIPRKEYSDKPISETTESIMENREFFVYRPDKQFEPIENGGGTRFVSCMMPILTQGDVVGCVATVFPSDEAERHRCSDVEQKLVKTAADFLGRQMED